VQQPANLAIAVIDNERYGETGMQTTHTASGVDLAAMASGCGFRRASIVRTPEEFEAARPDLLAGSGPVFAQIKVAAEKVPLVLPPHDGVELRDRFRKALLGA
jgi:thiamine pyrophosphate-dependent acetolactate synthase large subunit-like protein